VLPSLAECPRKQATLVETSPYPPHRVSVFLRMSIVTLSGDDLLCPLALILSSLKMKNSRDVAMHVA
jgi:hypothetical protein